MDNWNQTEQAQEDTNDDDFESNPLIEGSFPEQGNKATDNNAGMVNSTNLPAIEFSFDEEDDSQEGVGEGSQQNMEPTDTGVDEEAGPNETVQAIKAAAALAMAAGALKDGPGKLAKPAGEAAAAGVRGFIGKAVEQIGVVAGAAAASAAAESGAKETDNNSNNAKAIKAAIQAAMTHKRNQN